MKERPGIGAAAGADSRPRIIVVVGLPGAGKSTYLKKIGAPALSSDATRLLLADDEDDQTIPREVFTTMRYLLRQRVAIGRPVTFIDATHLSPAERQPYLEIGEKYDCRVEAMFFDIPLAVCLRRNRNRKRIVPEAVIEAMAARMVAPTLEEGFSAVHVIGAGGAPRPLP